MGQLESTQLPHGDGDLPPTQVRFPSRTHRPETPSLGQATGIETPPSFQHAVPRQAGRYVIEARIGVGGFADVYSATDPELHRQVVIKIPRRDRAPAPSVIDEFIREAQTAAKLQHSHIVTIHDVGRTDEQGVFIAMEYLAGGTLAQRISGDPLPVPEVLQVLADVAEAVHYAHKQGLVHRDLKPSNILFTVDGVPKVSDFGLAVHQTSQSDRTGEISGTPAYMSPEQVRGETNLLDGRSDIWGLGVILYECLTGRPPFQGVTAQEFYNQVLHCDPKPLRQIVDSIPPELDQLCRQCLSRDPAERPGSAHDLAVRLQTIGNQVASQRVSKRRREIGVAVALLAVASTLAVAVTLFRGSEPSKTKLPAQMQQRVETAAGTVGAGEDEKTAGEREQTQLASLAPAAVPLDWAPNQWNSLLKRPPRVVAFNTNSLVYGHKSDIEAGTFWVNTQEWGIFAFTKDVPPKVEIRVPLKKFSDEATFCIFWGLHRVEGETAPPIEIPAVLLSPGQSPIFERPIPYVHRARSIRLSHLRKPPWTTTVYVEEVRFFHADRDTLSINGGRHLLENKVALNDLSPAGAETKIALRLDHGLCTQFSIDGVDVPFDFVDNYGESLSYVSGELGLMADHGEIVVSDFSLQPSP